LLISISFLGCDLEERCDNIIPALKHSDRICELDLEKAPMSQLEELLAEMQPWMQQPFPELEMLLIQPEFQNFPRVETLRVIPDSFLGRICTSSAKSQPE
jgi:hypothetical protein